MSPDQVRQHTSLGLRASGSSRLGLLTATLVNGLIAFGLLSVLAVHAITPGDGPYASPLLQQGPLRQGLILGVSILFVPLVMLLAQSARLGAPARDRRLATYRLLGVTPGQVRWIASVEGLAPAVCGAVLGAITFVLLQQLLDGPLTVSGSWTTEIITESGKSWSTTVAQTHHGEVRLAPTDVRVPLRQVGIVLLGVPAVAVATAWLALRRVQFTPFGVIRRRVVSGPPATLPVVLLLLGLGGLLGYSTVRTLLGQPGHATTVDGIAVVGFFGLAAGSLVLGAATLSSRLGTWLSGMTSRPSLLMAARRLQTDPYAASRTLSLIVLALIVAVCGQAVKAHFLVITDPQDPFYADILRRVDVGYLLALLLTTAGIALRCAEAVMLSRQRFMLQLASGVPRATIRGSIVWETLIPLIPGVVAAAVIGILGTRGILGTMHVRYDEAGAVMVPIPVPWAEVTVLCALVLLLVATLSSLSFTATSRGIGPGDLREPA